MKEVSFTIAETCHNSLTESTNLIRKEHNSDKRCVICYNSQTFGSKLILEKYESIALLIKKLVI